MNITIENFHFEGSLDEFNMVYKLLTGTKTEESVTEKQEEKQIIKRKRLSCKHSKIIMDVKTPTGITTTMVFYSQKNAAEFLGKPDASSISNSIIKKVWTKGNRAVDSGKKYKFHRYDEVKTVSKFNQPAVVEAIKLCSKVNPIVHI